MVDFQRSPLAPAQFPLLPTIKGLRIFTTSANIKNPNREDLLLIELEEGSTVSGVFTQSLTAAAPVIWSKAITEAGHARALLANSGNANAFTGEKGRLDVEACAIAAADLVGCQPTELLIASTGVIGEPLPIERICTALVEMKNQRGVSTWEQAAMAIGTTDTYPKGATCETEIDQVPVKIVGIAKGSGMIAPNMATMLAFVFTDACIAPEILQSMLKLGVSKTFNCITVDSDTSTSDMLLLAATGQAGNRLPNSIRDRCLNQFRKSLNKVLQDLAIQVVRDGEGAKKLITVEVRGAKSTSGAHKIAMTIANSPLVKTAIAGEDGNWGRIIMAIGKSGISFNQSDVSVSIGGVVVAKNGERVVGYDESALTGHLRESEILIEVYVGVGSGKSKVWTCDLTHEYIRINADYRT